MHPLASFEPLSGQPPQARFCILHPAQGRRRGSVLHVHAFAEELNKTRRMVSQQARRLAECGFDVMLLDLHGCGDSPGVMEDATWAGWLDDVLGAVAWLKRREADDIRPLWLWGTRLGALLAREAAGHCQPHGLLYWQPVLDGNQHVQQFLRIADAQLNLRSQPRVGSVELLKRLAAGETVDVAGYRLPAALAQAIQRRKLDTTPPEACRSVWIEQAIDTGPGTPRGPEASSAANARPALQRLRAPGAAFWLQVDATDAPAWWDLTAQALVESTP
jgi:exosortase A-associated hydrolase 2